MSSHGSVIRVVKGEAPKGKEGGMKSNYGQIRILLLQCEIQ
jgi:hypothetical protein